MKKLYLILLVPLLLAACRQTGYAAAGALPQVLFAHHEVHFSWGVYLRGWFIGGEGGVAGYSLAGSQVRTWKSVDQDGYISAEDLLHNYNLARKQVAVIARDELGKRLEDGRTLAADSDIAEPVHKMYDAGDSRLVCYLWDAGQGKYKQVLLLRRGDYWQDNRSAKAADLAQWLAAIEQQALKRQAEID